MENVTPARAPSGSPQDLTKRISRVLIEAAAARAGFDGPAMFVCECGYPTCAEPVEVTLDEYGAARPDPTTFLVLPGHEITDFEQVVDRNARFALVKKLGEAGEIARAPKIRARRDDEGTPDRSASRPQQRTLRRLGGGLVRTSPGRPSERM